MEYLFVRIASLLFLITSSMTAAVIGSADGNTLAGGTLTVTWDGGLASEFQQTFAIGVVGAATGSGRINTTNHPTTLFTFSVDNETISNPWTLTNNRSTGAITGLFFDLSTAINGLQFALFDNGVSPLANNSGTNIQGTYAADIANVTNAVHVVTPGPIAVGNVTATFGSQYTGDGGVNMYRTLGISFTGDSLAAGETFTFHADSDVASVPEPATWLAALGFCAVGLYRRNRS
jgi:PEP-CTERM motif